MEETTRFLYSPLAVSGELYTVFLWNQESPLCLAWPLQCIHGYGSLQGPRQAFCLLRHITKLPFRYLMGFLFFLWLRSLSSVACSLFTQLSLNANLLFLLCIYQLIRYQLWVSLFSLSGKGAFSPSKKNLVPFGCTMKSFDSMWQAGAHVSFLVKIKDTQLLRWLHPSRVWGKACLISFTTFTRWYVSWISCTEWFSAVAACNSPPLGLLRYTYPTFLLLLGLSALWFYGSDGRWTYLR